MAAGKKITIEFLGKDSSGGAVSSVEKRFGKLGGRLDRIGQRAGKVLAVGFLAAGVAAVKLGQQASDLAETQSKVARIFGKDSTAALDKFAASAAKSLGQSKQTALDGAATFGILGKSAGLAGEDLVGFSTKMVKLAGDMASFNNTSPEEAIEAIGAGLRGEAEPLRRFGVLLDDATLRAEAMKLGLIKTTKEALTPQQKVLAAQSAILKQTSDQQGDFARTSDGLANKQRILKAQMENLGTSIGTKVLPALIKLSEVGLKMVDWIDRNRTTTAVLVTVLGSLAAGLYAASAAMRVMVAVTAFQEAMAKRAAAGQSALSVSMLATRGAALAAGVGLAALSSKASQVDTGLGALTAAASGAAIGFAVGGPFGAAIGGAVGLLASLTGKSNDASAAQNHLKSSLGGVTATLNEQTGALTAATRSTLAKALADSGAFTAAQKVGVAYSDVLDAALGNEAATKRVDAATKAYIKTNSGSFESTRKAAAAAGTLTSAVHGSTAAIEGERRKIEQTRVAMLHLPTKHTFKIWANTQQAFNAVYRLQQYINGMNGKTVRVAVYGSIGGISANAAGTDDFSGGPTWVGEKGPEILNLPRHSQIIPNHKTDSYMGSGGGDTYIFHISGVVGDEAAVGRKLEQILTSRMKALGRPMAFARP